MKISHYLAFITVLCLSLMAYAQHKPIIVFVKINESIMPIERGSKYEDPLDAALKNAKLGEVTGGGSSLSKEKKIQWVGIDVDLDDQVKGIPFLKKKLLELGAPKGSALQYEIQGKKVVIPIHE